MIIRTTIFVLLFLRASAEPRSPRIYNVLISSKKNLSPSHAEPVYEPVLRTTSIGYAFPSVLYHSSFVQTVPASYINPDYSGYTKIDATLVNQNGEVITNNNYPASTQQQMTFNKQPNPNFAPQNEQQLNQNKPPSEGQFIHQYNPYALSYNQYAPNQQGSESEPVMQNTYPASVPQENDPRKVIANLKRNPEIPDVPPPPLPVKINTKQ